MTEAISLNEKGVIIATQERRISEWISDYVKPCIDNRYALMYATTVSEFSTLVRLHGIAIVFIDIDFFGEEIIGELDTLSKLFPEMQVVLFSVADVQPEDAGRYLWWGADSFVSLRSEPNLIREQLKIIFDGRNTVSGDALLGISEINRIAISPPHFTPREIEIIRCIVKEKTIKETAKILAIRQHTVTNYLYNMYRRCGIKNIVGLIKVSFTAGVITVSDRRILFRPERLEA
jgi:DNA-binding NarL/FixJ family response regulator